MRKLLAVAVLVFTASSLSAQSRRPATFDDVLGIKADPGRDDFARRALGDLRRPRVGVRAGQDGIPHARLEGGDRRQLAGAADHVRRKGRKPGAVLSRRQVHQLRRGARQRGSQITDPRHVHRGRGGLEAHRRKGKRVFVFVVAGRIAHRVCGDRSSQRR